MEVGEEGVGIGEVFDRLEGDDGIKTGVGGQRGERVAGAVGQVGAAVGSEGVSDGGRREVDAEAGGGGLAEDKTAVAHATGEIEHTAVAHALECELVTLQVLESVETPARIAGVDAFVGHG